VHLEQIFLYTMVKTK